MGIHRYPIFFKIFFSTTKFHLTSSNDIFIPGILLCVFNIFRGTRKNLMVRYLRHTCVPRPTLTKNRHPFLLHQTTLLRKYCKSVFYFFSIPVQIPVSSLHVTPLTALDLCVQLSIDTARWIQNFSVKDITDNKI